MLQDRAERNKLRQVINTAEDKGVLGKDEVGFVITLLDRFRQDIDVKVKQVHMIQGEINQLRLNEKTIINLIENMVASAERDLARQETAKKLREVRDNKDESLSTAAAIGNDKKDVDIEK
jgi:hypothetical protein